MSRAPRPRVPDVDWSALAHAYGAATDVPGQLRCLLSPDQKQREAAFHELFGNIWHQGTVYSATPPALAFLVDLFGDHGYPQRVDLALLIACIVSGSGYYQVHRLPNGRLGPDDLAARLAEEADVVAAVRNVGRRALPMLRPFLEHDEAEVRATVFEGLASYAASKPEILPLLRATRDRETDVEARERMDDCLAEVGNDPG